MPGVYKGTLAGTCDHGPTSHASAACPLLPATDVDLPGSPSMPVAARRGW